MSWPYNRAWMAPIEAVTAPINSTSPTAANGGYRRAHSPDQKARNNGKLPDTPDRAAADAAPSRSVICCIPNSFTSHSVTNRLSEASGIHLRVRAPARQVAITELSA